MDERLRVPRLEIAHPHDAAIGRPLHAEDRGADDTLVIAGGPGAQNPELLAPYVDLFVLPPDVDTAALERLATAAGGAPEGKKLALFFNSWNNQLINRTPRSH